ncbi:MAG: hypothetical protein UV70_C0004G0042 [Parcubacteria group bacterium GW2011_GWA2_43_13]|nr:MAG: hypothetical protein UV70_C0004G0042 [Parcubacteria group bacterium GW2011_GWA2_43_13]
MLPVMKSKQLQGNKPKASTQQYLDIAEIRDDVVVLKDGTLRSVLMVSSINFALKSEEEQEAIVGGYVGFLNSINFSLQIVIQSRPLNIDAYIAELEEYINKHSNDLLRAQTVEYINFIKELIGLGDIMGKKFFTVISYAPGSDKQKGFFSRMSEIFTPSKVIRLSQKTFTSYRDSLMKRVDYVMSGLAGMGLTPIMLDTQGLIELFYSTYNPELVDSQKMHEIEKVQVESF